MGTRKTPRGFVQGNERIARVLDEPGMREAVHEIHGQMDEMDRVYAAGLAELRRAGTMTQQDLADRMGVDQGRISRIENRDDMLLSTLADYLNAVGAQSASLVASINGVEIELPLEQFASRHVEPTT